MQAVIDLAKEYKSMGQISYAEALILQEFAKECGIRNVHIDKGHSNSEYWNKPDMNIFRYHINIEGYQDE